MPGVFADILNSLQSGQSNQTPVQRMDQAGAQAITGARQGLSDFELLLRKMFYENLGGPVGPGGIPRDQFVGPMPQAPQTQENSIIQRLLGY